MDDTKFTHWKYRVIFHDLDPDETRHWYGLHEVYYTENGKLMWTENPISFVSDIDEGVFGVIGSLELAVACLRHSEWGKILSEKFLIENDYRERQK